MSNISDGLQYRNGSFDMYNSTVLMETRIAQGLWKYCSMVLLVIGTVGNVLAICVLLRRTMRSSSTMFYLTVMTFVDIFVLYTGLLRYWMKHVYNIDVRHFSQASCRAHTYMVYFSSDFAAWIMVALTVDRAIFICLPFRAKCLCTIHNARLVLVILAVFTGILNIHFFWMCDLVKTKDGTIDCTINCPNSPRQIWYGDVFHPWLDMCMASIVPFVAMLVCNTLIIRQMALSRRRLAAYFKREKQNAAGQIPAITQSTRIKGKTQRPQCSGVTITLLNVNIIFLVTTSPIAIFILGYNVWYDYETGGPHKQAVVALVWAVVNMMQYLNNSIHFFLFCLTGSKFRQELLSMFTRVNRINTSVEKYKLRD